MLINVWEGHWLDPVKVRNVYSEGIHDYDRDTPNGFVVWIRFTNEGAINIPFKDKTRAQVELVLEAICLKVNTAVVGTNANTRQATA